MLEDREVMLTFRPFDYSDDDYERLVAIDNAVFVSYALSVEEWRHRDESRAKGAYFQREMIELRGRVVAYGQVEQLAEPHKFFFLVALDPQHERPDIRPAFFERALSALAAHKPKALSSGALENNANDVAFLEASGFQPVLREISSELDMMDFDEDVFRPIANQVAAAGIDILSLGQLQRRDPEWKANLYELFYTLLADVPSNNPVEKLPLADFEHTMLRGPNYDVNGWFVALAGREYVGMSQVSQNKVNPEQMYGGLTGVVKSYRRRGIATALKLRGIRYARQIGAKRIVVFNEESNPMVRLNLQLGFWPKPAWVIYEKEL
jgi:mycothiol synthase